MAILQVLMAILCNGLMIFRYFQHKSKFPNGQANILEIDRTSDMIAIKYRSKKVEVMKRDFSVVGFYFYLSIAKFQPPFLVKDPFKRNGAGRW